MDDVPLQLCLRGVPISWTDPPTQVSHLTQADIGKRVTLNRLRNDDQSRPQISGRLLGIFPETYLVGMMRRTGFRLRIGHPRRYGGENVDSYGPFPGHHAVEVGSPMNPRQDR